MIDPLFSYLIQKFSPSPLHERTGYMKVGDGVCNDETNNAECNYDGGDCCGPAVSCKYLF